jgi:hypothetical protein
MHEAGQTSKRHFLVWGARQTASHSTRAYRHGAAQARTRCDSFSQSIRLCTLLDRALSASIVVGGSGWERPVLTVRPIGVSGKKPAILAVVLGVGLVASGCGGADSVGASAGNAAGTPCPSRLAVSLVWDRGGEATPIAAAVWFAKHGVASVPVSGWHEVNHSSGAAVVASSASTLHVTEGPDHAWQVDDGQNCG